MNPQIESAKSRFEQTSGRLLNSLESTPDDKLNWSPSPTARTPLEIAFHCAIVIAAIHNSLDGSDPMQPMTTAEMDARGREAEKTHGTKDEVVNKINETSTAYVIWLESLSDEKLTEIWHSPFGEIPLSFAITLPTFHTAGHIAQLDYIQTIYGDRVWH